LQKLFPAEFKSRQTKFGCLSLLWLGLHHFSESRTGRAWARPVVHHFFEKNGEWPVWPRFICAV